MVKKKKSALNELGSTALGLGGVGMSLGVGGAVAGRAAVMSPHVAPIMGGFGTIASGAGMITTLQVGKSVLKSTKKLKKVY